MEVSRNSENLKNQFCEGERKKKPAKIFADLKCSADILSGIIRDFPLHFCSCSNTFRDFPSLPLFVMDDAINAEQQKLRVFKRKKSSNFKENNKKNSGLFAKTSAWNRARDVKATKKDDPHPLM